MTERTWNIFEVGLESIFLNIQIGEKTNPEKICRRSDWIGRFSTAKPDKKRRKSITAIVNFNLVELTIVVFFDIKSLFKSNLYYLILFS